MEMPKKLDISVHLSIYLSFTAPVELPVSLVPFQFLIGRTFLQESQDGCLLIAQDDS